MDRKIVLWVVIAILVIAVIFVTIKGTSAGVGQIGQAASSAGQVASSGMVGGC